MANNNKVVVKFLADVDGLKKGVNSIDKQLSGFNKSLKFFAGTFAAAFSAKAIIDFSKASVNAFSDFEEAAGKVGQVFQDQAGLVESWSQNTVTSIGLSSQAALEAAGTFGNLFTAFGVGIPEAREMSLTLTELAADLASFNNTSIDQALTALRSGLSGETEPLKRFGVALNQAAIETEALNLGLIENKKDLDAASKSQAIYSLVMKQTTNAQGDFARTQDGLANTQRTLNAAFEEAQKTIGEGLYNAVLNLTDALGGPQGAAESIDNVAQRISLWVEGLTGVVGALEDVEAATKDAGTETRELADAFEEDGKSLKAYINLIKDLTQKDSTVSLFEVLGQVNRRTRNTAQLFEGLRKVKFADHLSGELEATARAARRVEIEAASASRELRKLFLNNPQDQVLRAERQGDSFLRQFNDGDAAWREVMADVREIGFDFEDLGTSVGGATKKIDENTKKVKGFTAQLGDFVLSVAQKSKKGKKITTDAVAAMTQAGQEAIQGLLDDLELAERQLVETQNFIAQQTASFLGPTNIKAVQQAYQAAKSEAEQLERAAVRAKEARLKAEAAGASEQEVYRALARAEQEAIRKAGEAAEEVSKGLPEFWRKAQESVVAYRAEIDKLRDSFASDGVITDAEAQLLKDVFTLPPDTGTEVINALLTDTGKALTANQQVIIDQTTTWMQTITDTFAGKEGFPAVGYTAAKTTRDDFIKELTSEKTKKKVARAVRKAVPKSVKVKVEWDYAPFNPNLPSGARSRWCKSNSQRHPNLRASKRE